MVELMDAEQKPAKAEGPLEEYPVIDVDQVRAVTGCPGRHPAPRRAAGVRDACCSVRDLLTAVSLGTSTGRSRMFCGGRSPGSTPSTGQTRLRTFPRRTLLGCACRSKTR